MTSSPAPLLDASAFLALTARLREAAARLADLPADAECRDGLRASLMSATELGARDLEAASRELAAVEHGLDAASTDGRGARPGVRRAAR